MKVCRTILMPLIILALAMTTACSSGGGQESALQQTTVTRGNLAAEVQGRGEIAAAHEVSLAFGSNGRVDEILVVNGDMVSQGDVLARLDSSALELAFAQAQSGLAQAQLARQSAELNLKSTVDAEDTLELAVLSAKTSVDQAQRNLNVSITAVDYRAAEANLRKAKEWYDYLKDGSEYFSGAEDYFLAMERAEDALDAAQTQYDNILAGYDSQVITIKKDQLKAAEIALAAARKNLDDLPARIAIAEQQVASAECAVGQATQAVVYAQKILDEATIVAPFGGVVTNLTVKEGDMIPAPAANPRIVLRLVDTSSLELSFSLDEAEISSVMAGQKAVIGVDALPGTELAGEVTSVSATPNPLTGTAAYEVKVGFTAPPSLAVNQGMNAGVTIFTGEHKDALLVASEAVMNNSAGDSYVKLIAGEEIKLQPVRTGISDGRQTEIIEGLNEGDTVITESPFGKWSLQQR